jgi:hypothetical protein
MNYQDIVNVRIQAERDLALADRAVCEAAKLIVGRLKSSGVQNSVLRELKRELKDYNMQQWAWKD